MTWSKQRQFFYICILFFFFLVLGLLIAYPYFNRAPTCTDGRQNGNEEGIDCGGVCKLACLEQTDPVSILWSRSFQVVPGRYNAVAYLVNHNQNKVVEKINYRFRFADERNVYIGKREGTTFVPPGKKFAVFESAIDVGNSVPVYTSFEFTSEPVWVQVDPNKVSQLDLPVGSINLEDPNTSPHLTAVIKNSSLFTVPDISVIAILYDAMGNAVSASKTYVNSLAGQESRGLDFTWQEPFSKEVIAKELIPLYDISQVKIQ